MTAKIILPPQTDGPVFCTTTKNTGMSQRATLEEVIVNLSTALGVEVVYKRENARGAYFYEVQGNGFPSFQSASNTVLELSRRLARGEGA